ncbi:MAG: AarF/UbiB family protein [Bacteriovoracaceae bacterium]|nr:AarF/UbiB family protein [Bacteriovoracaceae bacterium]
MKFSYLNRSFELVKLLTQLGIKEFQSSDLKSRFEQALLISKSLSKLKGAAMKAGQLLSLDLDDYFPKEAIEILSQLQNSATAYPFEKIKIILKSELKSENIELMQSLSPVPLGVASIGQVHKASYLGQEIVLKVQYADLVSSVESDLMLLKTIAQTFCQVSGRKMNLKPMFEEFRSILYQELDYKKEADFLLEYKEKLSHYQPRAGLTFRTPRVFPEISTSKVLAMTFEKGVSLRDWMNSGPNEIDRSLVATSLIDLYIHEFFDWGLVQTDPNLGNFLIDQDESGIHICLIDFGATRHYSRDFIEKYIHLLELVVSNKRLELKNFLIEFEFMDQRESDSAFQSFEKLLQLSITPFFNSESKNNYFNFADLNFLEESKIAVNNLTQKLVYSPPPHSILFLHRKLAGVYSILKNLNAKIDISPYWQMMMDLSNKHH